MGDSQFQECHTARPTLKEEVSALNNNKTLTLIYCRSSPHNTRGRSSLGGQRASEFLVIRRMGPAACSVTELLCLQMRSAS
jgi:hypothetical protein